MATVMMTTAANSATCVSSSGHTTTVAGKSNNTGRSGTEVHQWGEPSEPQTVPKGSRHYHRPPQQDLHTTTVSIEYIATQFR